jgi:hypothetical protein
MREDDPDHDTSTDRDYDTSRDHDTSRDRDHDTLRDRDLDPDTSRDTIGDHQGEEEANQVYFAVISPFECLFPAREVTERFLLFSLPSQSFVFISSVLVTFALSTPVLLYMHGSLPLCLLNRVFSFQSCM